MNIFLEVKGSYCTKLEIICVLLVPNYVRFCNIGVCIINADLAALQIIRNKNNKNHFMQSVSFVRHCDTMLK